jgi:mannose-1-phosphate guanylyltransferase
VESSVVFDGAEVGEGAVVTRSILGVGAVVGAGCVLTDVVLGDGVRLGERNELRDGARVFPGVILPDAGVRFSSDQS